MDEWEELEEVHRQIVRLELKKQRLYQDRCKQIHELSLTRGKSGTFLEGEPEFVAGVKSIEQELYDLWAQKRLLLASLDPLSMALSIAQVRPGSAGLSVDLRTPVMSMAD